MQIEKVILKNLMKHEKYVRTVLPFLKDEYFVHDEDKILYKEIRDFILKYNNVPSYDALVIEVESLMNLTETQVKNIRDNIDSIKKDETETNMDWLLDSTEKFCQEKAIYIAIMQSIDIMNNKDKNQTKGAIPDLLSKALSVTFDPNVGHDYLENAEERYEYYHRVEYKIPFDLEYFNKITRGGVSRKTLNIVMAGTGVGKSLFMCHMAAAALSKGQNVLYVTLELAEEEVAKRIDANLLNVSIDDLLVMPKELYDKKINTLKAKTNGKLIIKEYPTASANALHFDNLLNELNLKKSFKPDIIFIDYLNICTSSRVRPGGNVNIYLYIKSIAEELRGLAVKHDVPIVSATQTNRTGFVSSDVGLEDTSESFGLPATADFMFALISTEELENLGQLMVKQLKNRYNSGILNKRFVIGVDRDRMKLYDVEQNAQEDISDSGQVPAGKTDSSSSRPQERFSKFKI